ncbi:hypothetical protein ACS0TY_017598 [Phlomoides rotata]
MTGNTTRFANDLFEQKRAMIWENKLIGTENTRRKTCNMMHVGRWTNASANSVLHKRSRCSKGISR